MREQRGGDLGVERSSDVFGEIVVDGVAEQIVRERDVVIVAAQHARVERALQQRLDLTRVALQHRGKRCDERVASEDRRDL